MKNHPHSAPVHIMSSAKLLSPFRYPGGKTWLVPYICQWLNSMTPKPSEFIEPFAGGGIIGLNVAFKQLADHVTLVELDKDVAAVWETIIYGNAARLAKKIAKFDPTLESVNKILSRTPHSSAERAFQTILRNRVCRGGILASGAGLLKHGENGMGLRSRWYPETLRKRILGVVKLRERLTFIEGDGLEVMQGNIQRADAVFFIDPPYTVAGKKAGTRLYTHSEVDHEELFSLTSTLTGDFLMTYDNTTTVRRLARRHGFDVKAVPMRNTHHATMTELLIGRNLDWILM
jgi:DNA adenine methylase